MCGDGCTCFVRLVIYKGISGVLWLSGLCVVRTTTKTAKLYCGREQLAAYKQVCKHVLAAGRDEEVKVKKRLEESLSTRSSELAMQAADRCERVKKDVERAEKSVAGMMAKFMRVRVGGGSGGGNEGEGGVGGDT